MEQTVTKVVDELIKLSGFLASQAPHLYGAAQEYILVWALLQIWIPVVLVGACLSVMVVGAILIKQLKDEEPGMFLVVGGGVVGILVTIFGSISFAHGLAQYYAIDWYTIKVLAKLVV